MKFSVGYQIDPRGLFVPEILAVREKINEVYFAYGNFANGRHRQNGYPFLSPEEARETQLGELEAISNAGISLNLLLNANCYGALSLARSFYEDIGYTVDYLDGLFGLKTVTTTSPIIAKFIKSNFPHIGTRASVNMEIDTPQAMDYIKEYFDSFYLRREHNRNFDAIISARKWCDENGKELYMLANSGCLSYCPLHNFHDISSRMRTKLRKRTTPLIFIRSAKAVYRKRKLRPRFYATAISFAPRTYICTRDFSKVPSLQQESAMPRFKY